MATLEKPKKKTHKTKKTKTLTGSPEVEACSSKIDIETNAEHQIETNAENQIETNVESHEIEQKTNENFETQECLSTINENVESHEIELKPNETSSSKIEINELSTNKIETQETSSSKIETKEILPDEINKVIKYPSLSQIKSETEQPDLKPELVKCEEYIKPFTESQLTALYTNQEIPAARQFIHQFIDTELRGVAAKKHPLYDLITSYLSAREKLKDITIELNQLRNDCNDTQNQLWSVNDSTISGKGQCGDGSTLTATHQFKIVKFQRNVLESLGLLQKKIKRLANHVFTLYSFNCCLFKLKIEYYLDTVYKKCEKSLNISGGVVLREGPSDNSVDTLRELRLCISVLFYFQRQLHKDQDVVSELRHWLTNMIALLLRNADWQDHMYLLNHVLRCPAGINSWAVSYIQVPSPMFHDRCDTPFANRFVNHIIAVLSVILMPIDKRDAFLEQMVLNEASDMVWVVVDSDGESDDDASGGILCLKENDLVALLNQIPLAYLFGAALLVEEKDNEAVLDAGQLTEHHVLRLLAFSTRLVQLLRRGLDTYATPRYSQFAKRLCRLLRHVLQYASDAWEVFRSSSGGGGDPAMLDRLQVEFDAFFLRTGACLFGARARGSWQFLAVAPFHMPSTRTLWQFLYMLHLDADYEAPPVIDYQFDFKAKLMETSTRQQFNDRLCVMSVEQSYYLLNTFGNMILARNSSEDSEFIKFATLNLLQIGFTETENQESSRKSAAILLSNITQKYPTLISDILVYVRTSIGHLEALVFLFSELPLFLWRPTADDMAILSGWLLDYPTASVESFLARKILLNLNWNFNTGTSMLFLPLDVHRRTAVLLLEAAEKNQAQTDGGPFTKFAWALAFQLRLHAVDRGTQSVDGVPDLIRFDVVQRGVRQRQALALYCAVAMTTVGHLLPLVCGDGLHCLLQLCQQRRYDAALFGLYQIVPLFVDNIEALLMCSMYQSIIADILGNAAVTLDSFACLIEMHLHHPEWRAPLFIFWARSLTASGPQWNTNKSVLRVLNRLVSVAFFLPDIYQQIEALFSEILLEKLHDRNNGANSSLLSWVPLVGGSSGGSSVLIPGNGSEETWLMYLIISLEHQRIEVNTGLWHELLKQLFAAKGKTNIDASLKKAANKLKVPSYTSNGLCIYRWSQLALDTPLNHPLLPLIWQKFFSLYLERVPGPENNGSIGNKFFDGVINTSFLKKIKKRLQESVEHYKAELEETEAAHTKQCLDIFRAYILWLEEPIIMEATLYFPSLPPQYEPRYLSHTIQKTTSPWMELINYEAMRNSYTETLTKWLELCERKNKYRPPLQKTQTGDVQNPKERMLRRLMSYDRPNPPPTFKRSIVTIPALQLSKPDGIHAQFQPEIKKLQQYAEIYSLQVSEHTVLESQYRELMPQLYQNFTSKMTLKRTCKASCAGVANIKLAFTESRLNESIKHQLETNRNNFGALLTRSLQSPALSMCVTCACLEQTVELLVAAKYTRGPDATSTGVELFYYLLEGFNDEFKHYPPTQQTFLKCLERLGDAFVKGVESQTVRLLRKIIEKPARSPVIISHFNPVDLSSGVFLQVYQHICDQIQNIPEIVLSLVSKFDVSNWLIKKAPRLADRTKFIQAVFECLTKTGKKHTSLHEVYRRHLLVIFQHEFPNHYGEILHELLQHSGQQNISVAVWLDIINVLSHPVAIILNSPAELNDSLRRHATQQQMLHRPELQETICLLGRYFYQERLQFGLYGLYPKYRGYIAQVSVFFGQTFYAFTIATLHAFSGEVADNIVAVHLWPKLVELFAPWLIPYSVKDTTATWIQQLTDDRAVLLPWIQADIAHAQLLFNMFVDCVLFVADTLPASGCLYCYAWQFYATHFAHAAAKDYILLVVHASLSRINWEKFWPSLTDLEIMLKVLDQYLPDCHSFLGKIFLEIDWNSWLTHLQNETVDYQILSRVNHSLLHLMVKLVNEPSVRQSDKARMLLENWCKRNTWFALDVKSVESIFDWYIMSCDPRVVLINNTEMVKLIDLAAYQFLRVVSYHNMNDSTETKARMVQKRLCYIRAFNKLLVNCSNRHKNLLTSNQRLFADTITDHLITLLNYADADEEDILIREFLTLTNNPNLSQTCVNCLDQWMANANVALDSKFPIIRSIHTIADDDALTSLLEQAFASYFQSETQWDTLLQLLRNFPPKPKFEAALIQSGRLFTLYVVLLRKLEQAAPEATDDLLETIVHWLTQLKADEAIELKLPLFWVQVIRLSLKLCHDGREEKAALLLGRFVHQHLLLIAENKSAAAAQTNAVSWGRGLLGAIGLIKQNSVSLECRFICKSIGAYILAQLPDTKTKAASVRCFSGAGCPVGQPGGNTDCAKVLLKLEMNGMPPELKPIVETSLKQIQNPENSMHNAEKFLVSLLNQIYTCTKNHLQSI